MLEETVREWEKQIRREERREGEIVGVRKLLLQQLTLRFGRLPAGIRPKVEAISSAQELRKLARKVLSAKTLEEMGLS